MKSVLSLIVLVFLSSFATAQSNKEDIAIIQSVFGKEKKELVTQYMTIPEDKKAGFWAMYDEYEESRKALGRERIALIEAYANDYASLDDIKASKLMDRKLNWMAEYSKMQKKYFTSMSKLIGGLQASKFIQLEDYIENTIRLEIQESIPFIDELDKSKIKASTQQ